MNQALAQKNQASIAQAERNAAIEQENKANKYGYNAMVASGLNANDAITANQMGQMFGNDVRCCQRKRILQCGQLSRKKLSTWGLLNYLQRRMFPGTV
jgi:hypothetical protein